MTRIESTQPDTVTVWLRFFAVIVLQEEERSGWGQEEELREISKASDRTEKSRARTPKTLRTERHDDCASIPTASITWECFRSDSDTSPQMFGMLGSFDSYPCVRLNAPMISTKQDDLREVVVYSIGDSLSILKSTKA